MKSKFFILFLFIFYLTFISGSAQLLNYNFNFSDQKKDFGIFKSSSLILQITTPSSVICRYTNIKGKDYSLMEGFFDENYETIHRKFLLGLEDGLYKYYIKCTGENFTSGELEVFFIVSTPLSANLKISKKPPLKSGTYEITLTTSKITLETPSLSYTYDGISYTNVPLIGVGKIWRGYLIIPPDLGETVGSFKFSAKDLDGVSSNSLVGDTIFIVDTKKPQPIFLIYATGYENQIKLNWYYSSSDIKEFRIYRSDSPNLDYTYYYKSIEGDSDYFIDNDVKKGSTYYYRIAPVDNAENVGELSKEVQATCLLENNTTPGLKLELRGKVDNLIVSINSLEEMISSIQRNIQEKTEIEKNIFKAMKLDKELESSKNELVSIKRDLENLKLQNLKESELDQKLNSFEVKISILKKKIPENLILSEKNNIKNSISEKDLQKILLEFDPYLDEKTYNSYLKESKKIIESLTISSSIYLLQVIYVDGSSKDISFFEHTIESSFSNEPNKFFLLRIPEEVSINQNNIKMINLNYKPIRDLPLFSFDIDTKKIQYYIESKKEISSINSIILIPISEQIQNPTQITGNFLIYLDNNKNAGVAILILVIISLIVYFLIIKHKIIEHNTKAFIEKIKLFEEHIKRKDFSKAEEIFNELKSQYKNLNKKEKSKVYKKWEQIQKNLNP